jgi:hypothetical protein
MNVKGLLITLVAILLLVGVASAATTISIADVSTGEGGTATAYLIADSFPAGFAGCSINVSVLNSTVGMVQSISVPSWASLNYITSTPSKYVDLIEVDGGDVITPGDTNVVLATITLAGYTYGSTQLGVVVYSMDDDVGTAISPTVDNATFTVASSDMWPLCAGVTTNAATGVTTSGATLNGAYSGAYGWFVWGSASNMYTMKTANTSAGGAYSATLDGIPLMSGQTYYFRAASTCGYGVEKSFTAGTVTPVPTTTYTEQYYDPFIETKWNMAALANVVPTAYTDKWGYIIWALFWGVLFMSFWIRQEDVTVPAYLYIIIFVGLSLTNWMPTELVQVSWLLLLVAFGGIFYTWFRGRKNG